MALVTSSAAKAGDYNAYRSIMLGSSPASLSKKPTSAGSAMAKAQAPKAIKSPYDSSGRMVPIPAPAAKPTVSAPIKSPYDSSGRMVSAAAPAPGTPANQPPPAVPTSLKIDNTQGGAGAGILPGEPIVPPTDRGVPPNQGPGATGGGTQGGIPPPPPPAPKFEGVVKNTTPPVSPARAYPTFNAGTTGYDPNAYSAPKGQAYSQQAANQAPYTFTPQRLSATPGTAYPTITPGQVPANQRSTAFTRSAYPSAVGFGYDQQAIEAASADRYRDVPASMSYQTQRPANMPYTPGIGTANRVPTAPPQGYGQVTMPPNYGARLAQPSFMGYPGQGPATPPPPPIQSPYDQYGRMTQPSRPIQSPYDERGRMTQPSPPPPSQSPYDQYGRMAPPPPPPAQSPYDSSGRMGGSPYNPTAGADMAAAQGYRGPSYQEIMMRQQTDAYMPRLSPQELMAQRRWGSYGMGGY